MTYDEKLKMKLTKIKALAEEGTNNESIVAQNLLIKLTENYGIDLNFATEEIYTFDFPYKNEYENDYELFGFDDCRPYDRRMQHGS